MITTLILRHCRWQLRVALAISLLIAAGLPASAHDFWIQPSTFNPAGNVPLKIQLRVGDQFPGDIAPRNDEKIEKFIVIGPEGEKPIVGRDGAETAGYLRAETPGLYVIGYRSKPSAVTLESEKFEKYLAEKGLDETIAARKNAGETASDGREMFSRCAKSLVLVGQGSLDQADRAIGLRLELIAGKDLFQLKSGDEIPMRILFDGEPAAGRLIVARNPDHPEATVSARSDEHGHVTLKLSHPGMWIVTSVHMVDAPKDNEFGARWESLWASLSFQIGGETR